MPCSTKTKFEFVNELNLLKDRNTRKMLREEKIPFNGDFEQSKIIIVVNYLIHFLDKQVKNIKRSL